MYKHFYKLMLLVARALQWPEKVRFRAVKWLEEKAKLNEPNP